MFYQLEWTDKRGGYHCERGSAERLKRKLETIRCSADLWLLDEQGVKIETIGGCERAESPDDKRIKWHYWYDQTA